MHGMWLVAVLSYSGSFCRRLLFLWHITIPIQMPNDTIAKVAKIVTTITAPLDNIGPLATAIVVLELVAAAGTCTLNVVGF